MRERNRSGRGGRRRSGGDGEPDLFAKQLSEVVQQAFAATGGEAGGVEATVPPEAPVEDRGDVPSVDAPDGPVEVAVVQDAELEAIGEDGDAPKVEQRVESLPARMLNEFVYCPRLFYYEHVEGVFVESADTVKGAAVHARVDKGKGALPPGSAGAPTVAVGALADGSDGGSVAKVSGGAPETARGGACATQDEIHSRSVMLGSERLGVVAKMDLVEATLSRDGSVAAVQPVDYKVGAPREGADGLELWDADKMQLGLQCLVLRDNGYACDTGIIYYRKTKQRVPLELTPELEAWVISKIAEARACAQGPIPPPLVDSPKCARCSLAPVCLPDETRMLALGSAGAPPVVSGTPADEPSDAARRFSGGAPETAREARALPRRLIAPRDEKRALYLNTQGYRVGCNGGVLKIKESRAAGQRARQPATGSPEGEDAGASAGNDRLVEEVRVMDVCHVALFGNIQMSTQAVQRLCDEDIPVTWFSMGGWFYGMTRGHSLKNVLLRIEQFRHAADPASCLRLAQQFVRGKIHNHRVLFMRNHVEPPERTKLRLGQARADALATRSLEELLGTEGAAASVYFAQFGGMIRERIEEEDFLEGIAQPEPAAAPEVAFTFDFTTRNRRPPTDPVNALLSLAYSLLAKECTLAAYGHL